MRPESGFQIAPNWLLIGKWQWRHDFPKWGHRQFFWCCFVSLVNFSYWSKFHVNIVTGSGVMTISFYKGLNRNPEIGNTPSEFCQIPREWGKQRIPNLVRTFLIKYYWILQNGRDTAFTVSELLRENQPGQ